MVTLPAFSQKMAIVTDAIDEKGVFDFRYTCDADNSSPELRWSDPPEGTRGFALIAKDPDAPRGAFIHWVVYNIPAEIRHLPAGIPPQETLPNGIRQGLNSYGKLGYAGPCPPPGDRPHHYVFRLYALREISEAPSPRATLEQLLSVIAPQVLDSCEVQGIYQRPQQRKVG